MFEKKLPILETFSVSDEKENKSDVIQACRMFNVTSLFTGFQ